MERRVVTVFGSNKSLPRLPPKLGVRRRSGCSVIRIMRIDSRTLSSPDDQLTRPSGPTRGGKLMPWPNSCARSMGFSFRFQIFKFQISNFRFQISNSQLFDLNFGNGKQKIKNGIHLKMMSSRLTLIINSNSAQIVMIGIDNEQIMPTSIPPDTHGPPSGAERSL